MVVSVGGRFIEMTSGTGVVVLAGLAIIWMLAGEATAQEAEFTPLDVGVVVTEVVQDPGISDDYYQITASVTNTGRETVYVDLGLLETDLDFYANDCESEYWIELGPGATKMFTGCYWVPVGSPLWSIDVAGWPGDYGALQISILPFIEEAHRVCVLVFGEAYCLPTQNITGLLDGEPERPPDRKTSGTSSNQNLYVSAENPLFGNHFGGPQVVEVIINDEQYRRSGVGFGPGVTVDDNDLVMEQAGDGRWYAYFADYSMAMYADYTSTHCGVGLDFGDSYDADSMRFMHDACMNVLADSNLRDSRVYIQLFEFEVGSDIEVVYDNGRDDQVVTLTFDTVDDYAGLTLDRAVYPNGAHVQITIVDTWLDIDPTSDDIWTFTTADGHEAAYYGLFLDDVIYGAGLDAAALDPDDLANLMCDDNCILKLDPDAQGTGNVLTLQDTEDTYLSYAGNAQNPYNWGMVHDDWFGAITVIPTGSIPITVVEEEPGVFVSADDDDNSNLVVTDEARRGTSATIDYNDSATSILVGHGFASVDIALDDAVWSSGESAIVTIKDDDANRNSLSDEAMEISDPTAVIAALSTGNPFTIDDSTTYQVVAIHLYHGGDLLVGDWPADFGVIADALSDNLDVTDIAFSTYDVQAVYADPLSRIGIVDLGRSVPISALMINYDQTIDDLRNTVINDDDFRGYNFFNYDVRSMHDRGDAAGVAYDGITTNANLGMVSIDLVAGDCAVNLVAGGAHSDYVALDQHTLDAIYACDGDEDVSLMVTTDSGNIGQNDRAYIVYAPDTRISVVADFMSFGYFDDGVQGGERVANQIIRVEAEETGDDTGIFEGSLEFTMVNQLNVLKQSTYEISTNGDEPTFIVFEDLTDGDAPSLSYNDLGADGVVAPVSDDQDVPSHSGIVSFDSDRYKIADTVTITLEDADLNVDSDVIDIYTVVLDRDSPVFGQVGDDLGVTETFGDLGRLLDVTFDGSLWASDRGTARCSAGLSGDSGLDSTGFTLIETGTESGVFAGSFQIPADWCGAGEDEPGTTSGLDIGVNYLDFRDAAGEIIEVGDSAIVGAHASSISLDRVVYPVPFGEPGDFAGQASRTSYFPVHPTGLDGDGGLDYIASGDLVVHVRVIDPDFDTSASSRDKIAVAVDGTMHTGPVKISVLRGYDTVTLGYAGGPVEVDNVIYNGIPTTRESDYVRQFGPIREIADDAGIFEADITIRYTDGPSDGRCPLTSEYAPLDGPETAAHPAGVRFSGGDGDHFCILQGDILHVEYHDPTDASGSPDIVTDSATFDLRDAVLLSDESEYLIGADMVLTLIEPDFDLDTDQAEAYDLDLIEWDSDAATITMGDRGGNTAAFDPEPTAFRETGDGTGIFQTIIRIPAELDGVSLSRGEAITLEYTDWGPAGADYVGQEDEDITLEIVASDLDATTQPDRPGDEGWGTGGDVVVSYGGTDDPGYYGLRSWLIDNEDQVIGASAITDYLVLPYDIRVDFEICGESNAYYYPATDRITMCYELVDEYTDLFREMLDSGEETAFGVANALHWVFLHEMGHAVIDVYDLPITGQEENVADQFATVMMLREEYGYLSVWAMAAVYASGAEYLSPFWDTHALDAQRFYNMACMLYGKHYDDEIGQSVLDVLPEGRAVYCPGEYATAVSSWERLLADYLRN